MSEKIPFGKKILRKLIVGKELKFESSGEGYNIIFHVNPNDLKKLQDIIKKFSYPQFNKTEIRKNEDRIIQKEGYSSFISCIKPNYIKINRVTVNNGINSETISLSRELIKQIPFKFEWEVKSKISGGSYETYYDTWFEWWSKNKKAIIIISIVIILYVGLILWKGQF